MNDDKTGVLPTFKSGAYTVYSPKHFIPLENVFGSLEMNRTFFSGDDVNTDGNFAHGDTISWEDGTPFVVGPDSYDNPVMRPAGYAWSSVLDLAKFLLFLRNGNNAVLVDELREEMMSPQVNMEMLYDYAHYGYGLVHQQGAMIDENWYDVPILAHGGGIPGYAADFYFFPSLDFGFITLANKDGAYFAGTLTTALTTLADLPEATPPPSLDVTPEMLDSYEGHYFDPYMIEDIFVTRVGNDLKVEIPLYDEFSIAHEEVLIPTSPHNFIFVSEETAENVTFIYEYDTDTHPKWIRTRPLVAERVQSDMTINVDCVEPKTAVGCK